MTERVLARLTRAKCLIGLIEKELKQPQATLGYEECSFVSELEALCEEMGEAAEERMREITAAYKATPQEPELRYCAHCSADGEVQLLQQDEEDGPWFCPRCGEIADETEHGQDDFSDGIPDDNELAEAARELAEHTDGPVTVTFAAGR